MPGHQRASPTGSDWEVAARVRQCANLGAENRASSAKMHEIKAMPGDELAAGLGRGGG